MLEKLPPRPFSCAPRDSRGIGCTGLACSAGLLLRGTCRRGYLSVKTCDGEAIAKNTMMHDNPYARFIQSELNLRDELAIDRTILANERTLLSYLRGAVSLIIAGATFIHFIEFGILRFIGMALIPMGLITGAFGVIRYRRMDRRIRVMRAGMDGNPEKT